MSRIVADGISRVGDEMVRAALYKAAHVLLSRVTRSKAAGMFGLSDTIDQCRTYSPSKMRLQTRLQRGWSRKSERSSGNERDGNRPSIWARGNFIGVACGVCSDATVQT